MRTYLQICIHRIAPENEKRDGINRNYFVALSLDTCVSNRSSTLSKL